jgi:uncharacterized membrane protein YhhN
VSPTIAWGVALTVTGLAATLGAEWAQRRSLLFVAKPAASLGFLVVAVGSGAWDSSYGRWILVGLVLSLLGDVFLISRGPVQFQAGLVSFLLAHVAYAGSFLIAGVSASWALVAGGVALAAAWVVVRWLLPHVEKDMRGPVLAYIGVISVMLSLAIGTLGADRTALIAAGAALFYISDLFVARDRFVTPSFLNTLIGLPLYYLAQVLLALSVG